MDTARATPTLTRNTALGITQIVLWGGSYFLMAVIGEAVVSSTGWSRVAVVGALSLAILISGLPAPYVGRLIRRHGGRPVLIGGSAILAVGLLAVAASTNVTWFIGAWAIMGIGMAGCLYDPLFSAVGHAYGLAARSSLTQITLVSGFAITLCWPASHWIVGIGGWRMACAAYAIADLLVVIPLFAWAIPRQRVVGTTHVAAQGAPESGAPVQGIALLGASFTVASMIMTLVSVELLSLLQTRGIPATEAVFLSTLIGPAQVVARALEGLVARHAHPYWSLLASAVAGMAGLLLLAATSSLAWLAIVLYGAGNGMRTIVRGTLPLALYGRAEYAAVMGRLARAPLIGQAVTPMAAGYLMQAFGKQVLLPAMLGVATVNLLLALMAHSLMKPSLRT